MPTKEQITDTATDAVVASVATKSTYAGSFSIGMGWLMSNEAAVLIGILVAVAGFIVNLIFRWREDRRQELLFKKELEKYGGSE